MTSAENTRNQPKVYEPASSFFQGNYFPQVFVYSRLEFLAYFFISFFTKYTPQRIVKLEYRENAASGWTSTVWFVFFVYPTVSVLWLVGWHTQSGKILHCPHKSITRKLYLCVIKIEAGLTNTGWCEALSRLGKRDIEIVNFEFYLEAHIKLFIIRS